MKYCCSLLSKGMKECTTPSLHLLSTTMIIFLILFCDLLTSKMMLFMESTFIAYLTWLGEVTSMHFVMFGVDL